VRFILTAGQKGDAPQAAALLEGAPAEVVIADAAYDADHVREAVAEKGPRPSFRTILHAPSNTPSMRVSTPNAISLNAASAS
jgi:IS5 family transposase